jgi:uncharacterized protein with PIN domain
MGLILDSSIVIAAERHGNTVVEMLRHLATVAGDQKTALSAIGLTELVHALHRTNDPEILRRREQFMSDLLAGSGCCALHQNDGSACRQAGCTTTTKWNKNTFG